MMSQSHDPIRKGSILWMTTTALLMGMTILLSMSAFSIPVPGGHLYFCDAIINIAGVLLDPLGAFIVGGVGSFLGDFLFYPAPMFVSLVTHGLQAVVVSLVSHHLRARKRAFSSAIGITLGEIIMILGYTVGRAYVYATPAVSITKLPFECLQGAFGAVVSIILLYPMRLETTFHEMMRKQ